jgi:hypothetical protein
MAEKGRNMWEVYQILYIIVFNYIAMTFLLARNMANFKLQSPLLKVSNGLLLALTYCLLSKEPSNSAVIIILNVISP